ncbi:ACH96205.1 dnaint/rec-like protein [Kallithea virus]|uniref:ACH96205.1 dnaint/rec-like protein n=1 Tax=Kallithea virus TaxID=1654582 RepID=A0A0F7KLP0_9VIRU|nr:ACH96205.1 dnaint/rec-like protein [Kallithea virus]AKH40376.1 putative dnaint/rec [Kallithea virus]AQN78604.1 ACH96205.1 dnaint/rec-like protein [Kallithea virus]
MANTSNTMMNNILKSHTTSTIRKLNELELNRRMDGLPTEVLENLIRRKLPDPSKRRIVRTVIVKPKIPPCLNNAIVSLALMDEKSMRRRIEIFIGYCRYKNFTYNTTKRYFHILKLNGLFGKEDEVNGNADEIEAIRYLRPNKLLFVDGGKTHIRIVSMVNFKTFIEYLHKNFSVYTAPILVAAYTGLRSFEILQFSTYTIYQLLNQQQPIAIKRKHTVVKSYDIEPIFWQPVYNSHLNVFVENLRDLYYDDYKIFIDFQINIKLFPVTPKTLGNRIKSLYFEAIGHAPPNGFGIHSCRNMIAMLMAEKTENIYAIQQFLQHRNVSTTRHYIKADFTKTTKEFNRLTKYEFSNINRKLEKINTETAVTSKSIITKNDNDGNNNNNNNNNNKSV